MINYTCPDCGRKYEYAAEFPRQGGYARVYNAANLEFVCKCGFVVDESDLWDTMSEEDKVKCEIIR